MLLDSSVETLPSIGPRFTHILNKVGIETVRDLIYYFPFRYEDYSQVSSISSIQPGEVVTIKGQVLDIKTIYTRRGKKFQLAHISDGTQTIEVIWFNQPFLVKTFPVGSWISLSGKTDQKGRKLTMMAPKYERLTNDVAGETTTKDTLHTGRLVPVYSETLGLSSKWLRSKIASVLPLAEPEIEDFLPDFIRLKYGLSNLKEAIKKVHFPRYLEDTIEARIRLGFDEFFGLQLNSLLKKKVWDEKKNAPSLLVDKEKIASFVKSLPFELTASQKVACQEILQNLQKSTAMNRMLEGDVGSGKTIVAAIACYVAFLNGYQSAIMAPTQILATQHFNTLTKILSPLGVKISLILGGSSLKVEDRSADIFIGTHALLQKEDYFNKLGFIVIDEQHRFGVSQRAKLAAKTNELSPHVLTMTATPIPRTVALTAYGDLDVSVLTELPKGRVKIKTWVVPPKKREAAYGWIRSRVQGTDEQAFIVCPLIEQSEAESLTSVKAATVEYEKLSKEVFPDLKLGLLHGRIKGKEKDEIMAKFKNGELDILVATPVVEVGIDIPGATIIMIEAAERFGLAQLHQLRGRVGRGSKQSYCLLFTESSAITAQTRLKALERSTNGLELAELDLKMRGPGEIYGIAQHGYPELKVANYNDLSLIKKARSAAESLVDQLEKYPKVQEFIKVSSTPIAQN